MIEELDDFFARSFNADLYPRVRFSVERISPCTFGGIDAEGMVSWRPLRREPEKHKHDWLHATDVPFALQAFQFFSTYWSDGVEGRIGYEDLYIECGVWNEAELALKLTLLQESVRNATESESLWPLAWSATHAGIYVGLDLLTGEVWSAEGDSTRRENVAKSAGEFLAAVRSMPIASSVLDRFE